MLSRAFIASKENLHNKSLLLTIHICRGPFPLIPELTRCNIFSWSIKFNNLNNSKVRDVQTMIAINVIMVHNGILNKIYNQQEKKSARTKKSLMACSKNTKRLSTRYIIIAVTM